MAPSELRPSAGALNDPALPTALARRPSGIVLASALVNVDGPPDAAYLV